MPNDQDVLTWDATAAGTLADPNGVWLPPQVGTSPDVSYFQHVSDGVWELWLPLGLINTYSVGTAQSLAKDTLYAYPFVCSRPGQTIDRLGWYQTAGGGAGKSARTMIYRATSITNLYPDALLLDGGAVSINGTGVRSSTVDQELPVGEVLWAAMLLELGATARAAYAYSQQNLLGDANTLAGNTYASISVAQAWGAAPATFPAGATLAISAARFQVWARFSG